MKTGKIINRNRKRLMLNTQSAVPICEYAIWLSSRHLPV